MIFTYKDKYAQYDTNFIPALRMNEKCLNCGNKANSHFGWSCDNSSIMTFDQTPMRRRFLTQSMEDSISNDRETFPIIRAAKKEDEPHWKQFVCDIPGYCPCGISKTDCNYHA